MSTEATHQKLEILKRKHEFPDKLRTAIDENKDSEPAEVFLRNIESTFETYIYENFDVDEIDESKGLNCDRDTQEEVETAIRFFPEVLIYQRSGRYSIELILSTNSGEYNLKAAPFIPLFAKLGIELYLFEEEERGGLIDYVLRDLATSFDYSKANNWYHQELMGETFLAILKELRQNGLFKKEDIQKHLLIEELCMGEGFSEQRFQYLVDWDPNSLVTPSSHRGRLPIHYTTDDDNKYCRGFRTVFEVGIFNFPKEMGGLFHKDYAGTTAYQLACKKYLKEKVDKTVNYALDNQEENHGIIDSLIFAATKETVHLDCVYFLLRRDPAIVSTAPPSPLVKRRIENDGDGDGDGNDTVTTSAGKNKKQKCV